MTNDIRIKRVYDPATPDDGARVLVDRLWPRGISKETAKLTLWLKDVAPTNELRTWFGHEASRWTEFRRRYFIELDACHEATGQLRELLSKHRLTLVYSARDREHNQAVALAEYLTGQQPDGAG